MLDCIKKFETFLDQPTRWVFISFHMEVCSSGVNHPVTCSFGRAHPNKSEVPSLHMHKCALFIFTNFWFGLRQRPPWKTVLFFFFLQLWMDNCPILPKCLPECGPVACPLCLGGSQSITITGLQRPIEARASGCLGPGGRVGSPWLLTFIWERCMAGA